MDHLRFTTESSADGVLERDFTVGEVPGVLWSPGTSADTTPLVLIGHGGGLHKRTREIVSRARRFVTERGFRVVAIDAPGHGDRPCAGEDERAQDGIRRAVQAGDHGTFASISLAYGASLAERAVPEWRARLDALRALPEIGAHPPVGYGGGITLGTAIGIPLTVAEPRIRAAVFGGGFFVDDALLAAARRVTVPVEFLLQWDDPHVDRQAELALFDAFGTTEKTLHANLGGHGRVPAYEDNAFFIRHLSSFGG
jgi:pimeloyl-ACP methyl ester carboxylesterase